MKMAGTQNSQISQNVFINLIKTETTEDAEDFRVDHDNNTTYMIKVVDISV